MKSYRYITHFNFFLPYVESNLPLTRTITRYHGNIPTQEDSLNKIQSVKDSYVTHRPYSYQRFYGVLYIVVLFVQTSISFSEHNKY